MSILKELYYGNIQFDSKIYSTSSSFTEIAKLKSKNFDKLMDTLNDSQKNLFDKYQDANAELESIIHYDLFTYALKFGILLMAEVFASSDNEFGMEDL